MNPKTNIGKKIDNMKHKIKKMQSWDYIPKPPTMESLRLRWLIECGKCDYIKPLNF